MRSKKRQEGFTLIELVVVLALFSLLLLIAFPGVGFMARWKLDGAARLMAFNLRLLQQEAVVSGKGCQASFYIFNDSYRLEFPKENTIVYLPQGVFFDGKTSFSGKPPFVHFNNMGHPSSGGTVILKNKKQHKLYVIVAPVNGRIRVSKTPPDNWDNW